MSEPTAPPIVSPDGRFYWDGEKWLPLTTAASPTPDPDPAPAPAPDLQPIPPQIDGDRREQLQKGGMALTEFLLYEGAEPRAVTKSYGPDQQGPYVREMRRWYDLLGVDGFIYFRDRIQEARSKGEVPEAVAEELAKSYRLGSDASIAAVPVSEQSRHAILQREIDALAKQGYLIVDRQTDSVQMRKPKTFSAISAVLWFLLFGVGLVVYFLYYLGKQDERVLITVDEFGRVKRISR